MNILRETDPVIGVIYSIILLYFVLGGIGFYIINRKKPRDQARKSYVKFIVYFIIINILYGSIALQPFLFRLLGVILVLLGGLEMGRLWVQSGYRYPRFFLASVLLYLLMCLGFLYFTTLSVHYILYVFLIVSIFDSFSQITGQLWGRKKIAPKISPNKTVGGVMGGVVLAIVSSFLLRNLFETDTLQRMVLVIGIIGSGFAGDLLASLFKRKYGVKDYSKLIPGHGGVMDRFDSLIAAGAWAALYMIFIF